MNANVNIPSSAATPQQINAFISGIISHLEADKFMFQADAVSDDTRKKYELFCSDNPNDVPNFGRMLSTGHFVRNIMLEFLNSLTEQKVSTDKIAFSVSNSRVFVWFELKDDDEETEDKIYLLEAKINATYETYGFGISCTIVEESDKIPLPTRYQILPTS